MVHGPRGPFRWTAYVLAVTAFGAAIPTPLYPYYAGTYHFSTGVLGLVFGAYTPGVLLTLLLLAPQADRIGRRNLLYIGMVLAALAAAAFAFAPGVAGLAVARFVSGMAVGSTTSVATAAMSDLEPERDQHHVARVSVAANFGGFATGVVLSGLLATLLPDPSRLVYVLPFAAGLLGLLAVAATPETAPSLHIGAPWASQRISVPASVRRSFWVSVGGITACYSVYGFFAALVPSYVRTNLGLEAPIAAGAVVGVMFGTVALSQLGTAQIRDRRALMVGFPLLILALVALVVVLPLDSLPLVVAASAVVGAAVGLTFMGSVTLVDRVAPEVERGEILAGFYSAGYLALAVPTLGVAEISGTIGLVDAAVVFGSLLAVAVAVTYGAAYRTPTPPGGGGRPRPPHPRA
jgi:MFS family permease